MDMGNMNEVLTWNLIIDIVNEIKTILIKLIVNNNNSIYYFSIIIKSSLIIEEFYLIH